jgi:hypothetical protein
MPRIRPIEPTFARSIPNARGWLHELQPAGGARCIVRIQAKKVGLSFATSPDQELTLPDSPVTECLGEVPCRDAILDGDFAVDTHPAFKVVRGGYPAIAPERVRFYAFDLLWLNGADQRAIALRDRKNRLEALLDPLSRRVVFVEHVEDPAAIAEQAFAGSDVLVSKRADSIYRSGLSPDWLSQPRRHEFFAQRLRDFLSAPHVEVRMTQDEQVQAAGSAIAAFALAQIAIGLLSQQDPTAHFKLLEMVRKVIEATKAAGGPANLAAAQSLQKWLDIAA